MDASDREWVLAKIESAEYRTAMKLTGIETTLVALRNDIAGLNSNFRTDIAEIKATQSLTRLTIITMVVGGFLALGGLVVGLFAYGKDMFELALSLTQVK